MRHVFILNPMAGKSRAALDLQQQIDAYFSTHPQLEYSMRLTECAGDATRIAAEECAKGDAVRLYACGGDGTLQETANGIPPHSAVEIAVIPCGSGNDYVRTYGGKEYFLNLPDVIEGTAIPVDAVDCGGRRSLNIASIGMDAKVCERMIRYKNLPGVGGSLAYELAILDVLCHPIGDEMTITIETQDGPVRRQGKFLLALAANGQYYGGGYHGAPQASEDDGVLDFVLVKKISRFRILSFLNLYKAGNYEHLDCCEHLRGYSMHAVATKPTVCNVDGECTIGDSMDFTILPASYRFVLPATLAAKRCLTTETVTEM